MLGTRRMPWPGHWHSSLYFLSGTLWSLGGQVALELAGPEGPGRAGGSLSDPHPGHLCGCVNLAADREGSSLMAVIHRKFPASHPLVLIWKPQGAIWPSCHDGAAAANYATRTARTVRAPCPRLSPEPGPTPGLQPPHLLEPLGKRTESRVASQARRGLRWGKRSTGSCGSP